MEGLIGIAFNDFVLMAADKTMAYSIITVSHDQKKIFKLSDHLIMGVNGESGDTNQFAEYIEKNIQLYKMRNNFELTPASAASFIQRNLADALRSRSAYHVNLLVAGFNEKEGPSLYFMDYLATMAKLPYAIHGYGGFFSTSILDRSYRPDASLEDAIDLLKKTVAEIQKRLIISMPSFSVVKVDKDGITKLPDIKIDVENLGL